MSDLDDFFAKKDKKKKSKAVFKTIDILEEPVKEKKKKKEVVKPSTNSSSNNTESRNENGDDEWKEAVEEVEPDYSGLRIKVLTIEDQTEDPEENGDGDENESNKGGVIWNKIEGEKPIGQPEIEDEKELDTVPDDSAPAAPKKYVAPMRRNEQASAPRKKTSKWNTPNLSSVEDFPTLGMKGLSDSQVLGFEKVKSGGRQQEDPGKVTNHLELGNRFSSLGE